MFISQITCVLFMIAWALLPQFLPRKIAFVFITIGLILCWLINAKKTAQHTYTSHKTLTKTTYTVLNSIIIGAAFLVFFVILCSGTAHPYSVAICCLVSAALEIAALELIAATTNQRTFQVSHPWLSMYICLIPCIFGFYILSSFFQIGLSPVLWMVILVAALGLCLYATYAYRYPSSKSGSSHLKSLTAPCLAIALLITFSLNFALDSSNGSPEKYTATSIYRNRTDCITETGRTFSCPRCPTPVGGEGIAYIYKGWLGISYIIPEY